MNNTLRVFVDESIPENHQHRTTRQLYPLVIRQEDGTHFEYDHIRRFREKPTLEAAPPLPLSIGATFGPTQVTISSKFSTTVEQIFITGGGPRIDPPAPTKLISSASKSSVFGGASGSDELDESDRGVSYGPTLTVPLLQDASQWKPLSWLPEETTLSLYGRVLFGSFELFDTEIDTTQYSVGPRLTFPVLGSFKEDFAVGLTLSAGPAWLQTDVGNATGLDTGAGVQMRFTLPGGLNLIAGVELEAFFTDDFFSWGLLPILGLSLGL